MEHRGRYGEQSWVRQDSRHPSSPTQTQHIAAGMQKNWRDILKSNDSQMDY